MSRGLHCPNCGGPLTDAHTRDTGDVAERPDHACPWLWERRQGYRSRALAELNASLRPTTWADQLTTEERIFAVSDGWVTE